MIWRSPHVLLFDTAGCWASAVTFAFLGKASGVAQTAIGRAGDAPIYLPIGGHMSEQKRNCDASPLELK